MAQHTNNKRDERERESEKKREKIDFHYQYCICLGAFLCDLFGWMGVCASDFFLFKKKLVAVVVDLLFIHCVCVCVHAVVFLWTVQREFSFLFGCFSIDFSHCSHWIRRESRFRRYKYVWVCVDAFTCIIYEDIEPIDNSANTIYDGWDTQHRNAGHNLILLLLLLFLPSLSLSRLFCIDQSLVYKRLGISFVAATIVAIKRYIFCIFFPSSQSMDKKEKFSNTFDAFNQHQARWRIFTEDFSCI